LLQLGTLHLTYFLPHCLVPFLLLMAYCSIGVFMFLIGTLSRQVLVKVVILNPSLHAISVVKCDLVCVKKVLTNLEE